MAKKGLFFMVARIFIHLICLISVDIQCIYKCIFEWRKVTCWNGLEELWKGQKVFDAVLKVWQKNTNGRAAFLGMLQPAIILCRKRLIYQAKLYRLIQTYTLYCDAIFRISEAVNGSSSESVGKIFEN